METTVVFDEAAEGRRTSFKMADETFDALWAIAVSRAQPGMRPNVSAVIREAILEYLERRDATLK